MKFAEETIEIAGRRSLVALECKHLLQSAGALVCDAAIGAIPQVTLDLARNGLGDLPAGQIVKVALCFLAVHTQ